MQTKVMPNVRSCTVLECAYNENEHCHAGAITVDSPEPLCGTYFKSQAKGGLDESTGMVGACKNSVCVHNASLECAASGIDVSWHTDHATCDTFSAKM